MTVTTMPITSSCRGIGIGMAVGSKRPQRGRQNKESHQSPDSVLAESVVHKALSRRHCRHAPPPAPPAGWLVNLRFIFIRGLTWLWGFRNHVSEVRVL